MLVSKKIILDFDVESVDHAIKEAKNILTVSEIMEIINSKEISYVYLVGPNVSDLLVAENGDLRGSVGNEWNEYFNKFLCNDNDDQRQCVNMPFSETARSNQVNIRKTYNIV